MQFDGEQLLWRTVWQCVRWNYANVCNLQPNISCINWSIGALCRCASAAPSSSSLWCLDVKQKQTYSEPQKDLCHHTTSQPTFTPLEGSTWGKTDPCLQVLRLVHEVVQSLSSGQDPVHVLRHDVLHSVYLILQSLHLVLRHRLCSLSSLLRPDRKKFIQEIYLRNMQNTRQLKYNPSYPLVGIK